MSLLVIKAPLQWSLRDVPVHNLQSERINSRFSIRLQISKSLSTQKQLKT